MSQTPDASTTGPTMCSLLVDAARQQPNHVTLIVDDLRLNNQQRLQRARRAGAALLSLDLKHGDHIGLFMPNGAEYLDILFGAMLVGLVPVTFNSRYKSHELAYVVNHSDVRCLFTTGRVTDQVDFLATCLAALAQPKAQADGDVHTTVAPGLKKLVVLGEHDSPFTSYDVFLQDAAQFEPYAGHDSDVALMMYTSGTTANPKGCLLSHRSIVGNAQSMVDRWAMHSGDRFWDPLPFFHMSTILPIAACLVCDAEFYATVHFDVDAALTVLRDEKITIAFPAFPTLMNALLHHSRFCAADLEHLRLVNNVAPIDTLKAFQTAIPQAQQVSAYGLTEAGGVVSYGSPDDNLEARTETSGKPFAGIDVRAFDTAAGKPCATGTTGELQIRGYCVFDGYYKAPEANEEALVDGWLNTGDIGLVTAEGYVCYRGRSKDMLKVGGENVAALEIESYLNTHPDIVLSQVIGVPDERLLEVAAAFIQLADGASLCAADVIDFCCDKIARYKTPRYVVFVDQWPMSATKVQKFKLQDLDLGARFDV